MSRSSLFSLALEEDMEKRSTDFVWVRKMKEKKRIEKTHTKVLEETLDKATWPRKRKAARCNINWKEMK